MDFSSQLCVLVVVYNVHCSESTTCQGLLRIPDLQAKIIIFDNSTRDFENESFCREHNWVYLGGAGNVGISKAYNTGIDYARQRTEAQYVCLFDDDTNIDKDFFVTLHESLANSSGNIFVPFIYSGRQLLSPSLIRPHMRIKPFAGENEAMQFKGMNVTAINSCMTIRLSLFDSYRYDENIFLDGVDHNFLNDMRVAGERVQIIPYACLHDFSGNATISEDAALFRFNIYAKDHYYILRNHKFSYYCLILKRMLRLTLRYKSLRFFKIIVTNHLI